MRQNTTALIGVLACLPLVLLAFGVPIPGLTKGDVRAIAQPVPEGDCELAWLHTTTNASTWERFVTGFQRATLDVPGLTIDDSRAFPNDTTTVPEIRMSLEGHPGRVLIRWYKISNEATHADWCRVLAARNPSPLAIIGGGSSDRASDLARALQSQTEWQTARPLLFLTTASAILVPAPSTSPHELNATKQKLVDLYDDLTFRFCFSNRQMAEATVEFIWSQPDLSPGKLGEPAFSAAMGATAVWASKRPHTILLQWDDDPFSMDLLEEYRGAVYRRASRSGHRAELVKPGESIPFSIGGFYAPNRYEQQAADFVIDELKRNPDRRSLLVLPTVTASARRVLRTICEEMPDVSDRLVVVNGDGIPMNAIYRDGENVWPIEALPVPLVIFAHANPVGWDEIKDLPTMGIPLLPPTSTEDVLLFSELASVISHCAMTKSGPVADGAALRASIYEKYPDEFDSDGNRHFDRGGYIIKLLPKRSRHDAKVEIWSNTGTWEFIRSLPIPASKSIRSGTVP
ncbi:MAG: hypothetical protein U0798_13985 [Gemmataceae bacterium]